MMYLTASCVSKFRQKSISKVQVSSHNMPQSTYCQTEMFLVFT